MKRIIMALVAMLLFTSCWVDVDPGYVGVRVWKRGKKAGTIETLPVGRHDWSLTADDTTFPTYKQNYVWTQDRAEGSPNDESIIFPIEGLKIGIDVGIEFSVIQDSVGTIYSEYRMNLEGITDGPMRNYVRDSILNTAKDYTNMEQFISNNEIANLITTVEEKTRLYFNDKGIGVSKVYLVGAPRYPESVVNSIEAKIEATQRAIQRENELREAEAQAKKDIAMAESKAQTNRLLERSLTDRVLKQQWIEKWNGQLPEVITGDSAGIMIDLNQ